MAGDALECVAQHWCPQPGEQVRVVFPGSKRDGKLATVEALKQQDDRLMAILQVDGESKPWTEVLLSWLEPV